MQPLLFPAEAVALAHPFAASAVRLYSKGIPERGRAKVDNESDSDSDSDDEGPRRKRVSAPRPTCFDLVGGALRSTSPRFCLVQGESEFWRRKMRTLHGLLDLNKDGVISYDDYKLLADRFVDLGHLSAQDTQEFHKSIQASWLGCLPTGRRPPHVDLT